MTPPDPEFVAASRQRDLLLTLVMVAIGLTPAWLAPAWISVPWQIAGVIFGVPALYYSWHYAPWVPTPADDLPRILQALAVKPDEAFCDLGAGDGRMLIRVHEATGAPCTGFEVAPLQYLLGRLRVGMSGAAATRIVFGDVHQQDLSEFDVLYVWGTAYWVGTPEFGAAMRQSMKPGARLISYHQPLVEWHPVAVDEGGSRPIYSYVNL